MKISKKDSDWALKQVKSRHRPRSTTFYNELDKSERRGIRRKMEKDMVEEEIAKEEEYNLIQDYFDLDELEEEMAKNFYKDFDPGIWENNTEYYLQNEKFDYGIRKQEFDYGQKPEKEIN